MSLGNNTQLMTKVNTSGVTIPAFVAVMQDLANDYGVKTAGANDRAIGIGPEYLTVANDSLPVCFSGLVYATVVSSVTRGDRLNVSSTAGQLQSVPTGGTAILNVVGYAAQNGAAGQVIEVQVELYVETAGDYLS